MKRKLYMIVLMLALIYNNANGAVIMNAVVDDPKLNISGNWILNKTYTKSDGSNFQDIIFYNGLGYPEQVIQIGASAVNGKNIVTPVIYDSLLRSDAKTYLPYVSSVNTLVPETNPLTLQRTFYTNLYGSSNGQYAYVEKVYEPSVLNRISQQYNTGYPFRSNSKKIDFSYATNNSSEVFKFDVSSTNSLTVSYYSAGVLYKNSITNEDGTVSYSFTDKSGRKVLDRTVGESSVNFNTYYAYDDFGRLAWVISPEGSSSLSTGTISTTSAIATKYSYIYTYDGRGNVIEKRVPGKGDEYFVYDKGGRPVMSQDAQMRLSNDWVYYVYDNQNRLIDKSVIRGTMSRQDIQDKYNGTYFDNTYPLLGGSDNTHRPFDTQDFSVIYVLESTRYKDNSYRAALTEQTYSLAMSGTYLKVYTDWIINWGATSLDPHSFYIRSGDYINDLYYICTDPNDPLVEYYYIPTAFTDIVQELTEVDPTGAYEVIYNYPGSALEITSISIVSSIPPTSRTLYTMDSGFGIPSSLSFAAVSNVVSTSDNDASTIQGAKVYEKAGILGPNNTVTGYVERAYYYDYLGRVVQMVEKNHLGGISRTSTKYDLIGNVLAQHESHQPGSGLTADTKLTTYTYNGNNRGLIASETTTVNSGTAGTITYAYNELGQLTGKTYGNGASEALTYNIQGWLSTKSAARSGANLFNMTLRYYDATKGTSKFTGDITEWQWTQGSNPANIYSFSYDKLSRLTNSNLYVNNVAQNAFTEKNLTYDLNGNINQLQRYGSTSTLQDNFTYAYNGNTLTGITGSVSASYSYDGNGNMTSDGRKNLAINYNVLNLQQSLSQSGTTVASYTYLTDGTKCAVVDNTTNGFDYLGSLIYSRSGSTRTFESAAFGGGRIVNSSGTYSPYYYINDHLGSTRVITNNSGTVVERNDYYPFGGKHANATYPQLTVNRQKFNGKELQTTGNTNFIDYGARMYDDAIGRWGVVDPMGENYYSLTGYNYGANNPVRMIDPTGMWTDTYERHSITDVDEQQKYLDQFKEMQEAQQNNENSNTNDNKENNNNSDVSKDETSANNGVSNPTTDPEHTDAFNSFWGMMKYIFLGPNVGDSRYNLQGDRTGPALITGIAPTPGNVRNFENQLLKQLSKDGAKSIYKSLNSLEKRLLEHQGKLLQIQYKSSVEREIRTFEKQIQTIKKIIKENGL